MFSSRMKENQVTQDYMTDKHSEHIVGPIQENSSS